MRKVELMKMRHKAIPADAKDKGIPLEQKLFLKMQYEEDVKMLWFRKVSDGCPQLR